MHMQLYKSKKIYMVNLCNVFGALSLWNDLNNSDGTFEASYNIGFEVR